MEDTLKDYIGFKYGMEKPLLYKVSLRIVNLVALFLIFLASSAS